MPELYHISPATKHKKLGAIHRTTSPESTCPPACPFKGNGCFGENFPCNMHWYEVTAGRRGLPYDEFLQGITCMPEGTVWRDCMVGDQPGEGDVINPEMFRRKVEANRGRRGFTYTHKPVLDEDTDLPGVAESNRQLIKFANDNGFTVNLSANNLAHADKLVALGIGPVAVVVPKGTKKNHRTPDGHKVVMCPAKAGEVTCETCGLCARRDRTFVVGLEAHGSKYKQASAVARGE